MNFHVTTNKTEEMMTAVTVLFKRNKRKYFVACRTGNNKPIDYIDGCEDIEFLKKCKKHIDTLIERAEAKNGKVSSRRKQGTETEVQHDG